MASSSLAAKKKNQIRHDLATFNKCNDKEKNEGINSYNQHLSHHQALGPHGEKNKSVEAMNKGGGKVSFK